MSDFFKTSTTWIVDYRYDGHPRRMFRTFGPQVEDPVPLVAEELRQLHGVRVCDVTARRATADEEGAWLRGDVAPPAMCPTGRRGS